MTRLLAVLALASLALSACTVVGIGSSDGSDPAETLSSSIALSEVQPFPSLKLRVDPERAGIRSPYDELVSQATATKLPSGGDPAVFRLDSDALIELIERTVNADSNSIEFSPVPPTALLFYATIGLPPAERNRLSELWKPVIAEFEFELTNITDNDYSSMYFLSLAATSIEAPDSLSDVRVTIFEELSRQDCIEFARSWGFESSWLDLGSIAHLYRANKLPCSGLLELADVSIDEILADGSRTGIDALAARTASELSVNSPNSSSLIEDYLASHVLHSDIITRLPWPDVYQALEAADLVGYSIRSEVVERIRQRVLMPEALYVTDSFGFLEIVDALVLLEGNGHRESLRPHVDLEGVVYPADRVALQLVTGARATVQDIQNLVRDDGLTTRVALLIWWASQRDPDLCTLMGTVWPADDRLWSSDIQDVRLSSDLLGATLRLALMKDCFDLEDSSKTEKLRRMAESISLDLAKQYSNTDPSKRSQEAIDLAYEVEMVRCILEGDVFELDPLATQVLEDWKGSTALDPRRLARLLLMEALEAPSCDPTAEV